MNRDLVQAATEAVEQFETIAIGAPFADARDAAGAACAELETAAAADVFPAFVAASANDIALYEFHEQSFERSRYGECLVDLHARACRDAAAFATFLRSGGVFVDRSVAVVTASAAAVGLTLDQVNARVSDWRRDIAAQVVAAGVEPPSTLEAAAVLAVTVPALRARVEACARRHQAHLEAALATQAAAERAAAEALVAAERAHRGEVAAFFAARDGERFLLRGRVFGGGAIAVSLRDGAALRDQEAGEIQPRVTLGEAEALRARTTAADAVTS